MRKWVPVFFGLALAACTFDPSAKAFFDDEPAGASEADGGDAPVNGIDAGGNFDAADNPVDEGTPQLNSATAIVRYYLNDAAFFEDPSGAKDAIGNPELNLALTDPEENTAFVTIDDHQGISFDENNGDARLSVAIQNTKIRDGLHDSKTGTIELVLDVDAVVAEGSRLSHIGDGADPGLFSLRASSTNTMDFYMNNVHAASWNVDLASSGRVVLHLVLDTTENSAGDRVRMYLNGQLQSSTPFLLPLKNQAISISNAGGQHYVVGNREIGDRNPQGTFYYAAMYSGAMGSDVVAYNASLLQSTDDSAQIVGQ